MQNAPDSDRSYHTLNRKPTIPRCASRRSKVGRIAEKRTLCLWSLDDPWTQTTVYASTPANISYPPNAIAGQQG